jgi:adenine-specific DNA-methyltransferase
MTDIASTYGESVSSRHRQQFGQFFTDPRVASFMVDQVLRSGQKSLYDPCFGHGAFFDAVSGRSDVAFYASEVDPTVLDFWKMHHPDTVANVHLEDYFKTWGRQHLNIVCNPPYMRFQKFSGRQQVFQDFEDRLGIRLSGYTNTASAFLLKSLSELAPGGRLAYIMPLEFLNAGYGTLVKQQLLNDSRLKAIISLNCEKDVFPDVITSVGIILVNAGPRTSGDADLSRDSDRSAPSAVDFHVINHIGDLPGCLEKSPCSRVAVSALDPADKWLKYLQPTAVEFNHNRMVPLEYYGRFSRGIATGANEFFALSADQVRELGLQASDVTACITRSSHIKNPVFSPADLDALARAGHRTFLFSPGSTPSAAAQTYISAGESAGYHTRFLTSHRNPWYRTEVRQSAPILLGVFSRGGYKVIRNYSDALNMTCYHGFQLDPSVTPLYEVGPCPHVVDCLFLYLFSDAGRRMLSLSMRKYGDSLDKFEPNDLNRALVPKPEVFALLSECDVRAALNELSVCGTIPASIEAFFSHHLI